MPTEPLPPVGGHTSNVVRLRGRVSTAPEERRLPSGAAVVRLRLSIPRERSPMAEGSSQTFDWVDCSAWGPRPRRTVSGWRAGDTVEVEGALRRRFARGDGGTSTRLEVEVLRGRLVARSTAPARAPSQGSGWRGRPGGDGSVP